MKEGPACGEKFYVERKHKIFYWEYWSPIAHDGYCRDYFKTKELAQKFIEQGCTKEAAYPERTPTIIEEIIIRPKTQSKQSRYDLI